MSHGLPRLVLRDPAPEPGVSLHVRSNLGDPLVIEQAVLPLVGAGRDFVMVEAGQTGIWRYHSSHGDDTEVD